ncbi:F420-0:Gamma-glutamyl ligase [Kovacikia minuta CCNUW1]|uniref:F420-0:Gamma-glutamyl ligase n=1 Tax=Kovacikia minuta TaxID=2931930 RepID=UPI001CCEBAC5|nr:F420-0:Gamma-glutamyl ligase [Kovacikia minuta]UBF29506.1 F420-0:Gamma-glutamyl ligase [Kovacikia minuta CCNUW1]
MGSFAIAIVIAVVLVFAVLLLTLEIQYRRRPGNRLELTSGNWQLEGYEPHRYFLVGEMEFRNLTRRLEVMVPEVKVVVKLLSSGSLEGITTTTRVIPRFKDASPRDDGYWEARIVKVGKADPIEVTVELQGANLSQLKVAWIQLHYTTYGPQGRIPKVRHVIVPLTFPSPKDSKNWRPATNADVLPIRTHLLTHLDDPVEVVQRYVVPNAQPGDVVAIGETPIAIMQGRFRHPTDVKPGWVARRLCYLFLPTSSLATACGMQSLIDIVGPVRVLVAFLLGAIAKVFGKPGLFYQLAGEQARLIDDVTGTLPPYDQFIVLGPENPQMVVDQIRQKTGLSAAIVDVNDLKAVKVLAATSDLETPFLTQALLRNPAGNAAEQTPVVLIRPVAPQG